MPEPRDNSPPASRSRARAASSQQRQMRGGTHRSILLAGAALALGLSLAIAGALLWGASVRRTNQRSFQSAAAGDTATLGTLLRRDADFVATLRAVLTLEPPLDTSAFERWFAQLQGRRRQVGGLGTIVLERVPAPEVHAFLARRSADPAFRALVLGRVERKSGAGRSAPGATGGGYSCLLSAGAAVASVSEVNARLIQGDWCDPSTLLGSGEARLLERATDSGQTIAFPVAAEGRNTAFFETAFYRRGAQLASVAQRRAAVAGWIVSSFDVGALIRDAARAQRGLEITLTHTNPAARPEVIGRFGAVHARASSARSTTLHIEGPWRVDVRGVAGFAGPPVWLQELLVFAAGAIVSMLLCALVLILARSRSRALMMVQEKTGQLEHQALHDALTGLPNRVLALDRATQMLGRARRYQTPVAALYVDIDGFKQINDSFGHAAGDQLLRTIAARLQSVVREGDTAARLAGDEFIVLVEGSKLHAGAELVAERLLEVLRHPYELPAQSGRPLSVTASIGIASGLRESADELLRDADIAKHEAKAAGRDRYASFHSGMQTAIQDELTIRMDLAEALERDELSLLYQPIFDLHSESVIGAEALIRWHHPARGTLSPGEFVPIAERSGLIVPVGRRVLRDACRQAARWHRQGHLLGVSVNVAARQLDGDELIEDVRRALADAELDAGALTLEVTETDLMRDTDATAVRLRALKRLGVRIAIDDFGTGYSSLSYLRQFPADVLKIDRSFISGIATSGRSTSIVRTLVQLGKTLGIDTLAEGIETHVQLRALQREGCDQGQGFLLAAPMDARAIEALLDQASLSLLVNAGR